ncbi:MAG TPA: ABC transporter permease [Streptosporangiaceae bacterium]|nr:ABC transporter permease [Streptosporangiaceae bacterium]
MISPGSLSTGSFSGSSVWARPLIAGWRVGETLRFGWLEYRAANPPGLLLTATGPRLILQTLFLTVLGGVLGGAQQRAFAFVGALAIALGSANVVYVSNIAVSEKQFATFWRVRSGRLSAPAQFFSRAAPYPFAGLIMVAVTAAIVGPVVGLGSVALRQLPLTGLYALISLSTTAAGLAGASVAIGRNADQLATNVITYLIILCSGGFLPPGRIAWVTKLGSVLPVTHGLAAIRANLAHLPWAGQALEELAVCAGWAAIAAVAVTVQAWRARRTGNEDYS